VIASLKPPDDVALEVFDLEGAGVQFNIRQHLIARDFDGVEMPLTKKQERFGFLGLLIHGDASPADA
jgi:hypothetical protein